MTSSPARGLERLRNFAQSPIVPSAALLAACVWPGFWDPFEVNAVDFGRRVALNRLGGASFAWSGADNGLPTLGDLGHGELYVDLCALGLRLFGVGPWCARLPMTLLAIAAIWLFWWVAKGVHGRRTAALLPWVLVGMPLFGHACTSVSPRGPAYVANLLLTLGLSGLAGLLPGQGGGRRVFWLSLGVLGGACGLLSNGILGGVLLPLMVVAAVKLLQAENSRLTTALWGALTGVAVGLVGYGAWRLGQQPTQWLSWWAGAVRHGGRRHLSFDGGFALLSHGLFPLSALIPALLFLRRGASPWRPLDQVALLTNVLAYPLWTSLSQQVDGVPYLALPWIGWLLARQFAGLWEERRLSPLLAAASLVFAFVTLKDFQRLPEKALVALQTPYAQLPLGLHQRPGPFALASLLLLGAALTYAYLLPGAGGGEQASENEEEQHVVQGLSRLRFWAVFLAAVWVGVAIAYRVAKSRNAAMVWRLNLSEQLERLLTHGAWALPLGAAVVFGGAWLLPRGLRRLEQWANLRSGAVLVTGALASAWLWNGGFLLPLRQGLSPQEVFKRHRLLAKRGEAIASLGVSARATRYFTSQRVRRFAGSASASKWLFASSSRRFMAIRASDYAPLNALARSRKAIGGADNLPILSSPAAQALLVSNRLLPGENDASRLHRYVASKQPWRSHRTPAKLGRILEVIGWDLVEGKHGQRAKGLRTGRAYTLLITYRVLAQPKRRWKSFVHIDSGKSLRFNADHVPLEEVYPMQHWRRGDYITDHIPVRLSPNFSPGAYSLYFGFFRRHRRLPVRRGKHHENRVIGGKIQVRLASAQPPGSRPHLRPFRVGLAPHVRVALARGSGGGAKNATILRFGPLLAVQIPNAALPLPGVCNRFFQSLATRQLRRATGAAAGGCAVAGGLSRAGHVSLRLHSQYQQVGRVRANHRTAASGYTYAAGVRRARVG